MIKAAGGGRCNGSEPFSKGNKSRCVFGSGMRRVNANKPSSEHLPGSGPHEALRALIYCTAAVVCVSESCRLLKRLELFSNAQSCRMEMVSLTSTRLLQMH